MRDFQMRVPVSSLVIAAAVTFGAATADAAPNTPARAQQMAANSVERHAIPATYTGPQLDVGYSSSTRRIADCLASFPGYSPKTDYVWSRSGPKQRCKL
jgi:hypothetical protein